MNAEQFAYWLQGFAELNPAPPTPVQWQAIRDHLGLVFDKQTPLTGDTAKLEPAPIASDGNGEALAAIIRQALNRQKLRDLEPTRVLFC